ncbi:MAG: trypsin-like peptidase domain-containing protein [Planctomycetota bacterium]
MENPVKEREFRLGRAPESEFRIEAARGIRRHHATIREESDGLRLHARGPVRLNGQPVRHVLLHDKDLLQLGHATLLRIHMPGEKGNPIALEPAGRPARARSDDRVSVARIAVGVIAFATLVASAALVVHVTRPPEEGARRAELVFERQRTDTHIDRVREDITRKLGAVERSLAHMDSGVDARIRRAVADNPELRAARVAVEELKDSREAAERVIARCAPSVCVIQGAYAFGREVDGEWRYLREIDKQAEVDDNVPLSLDGKGEVFRIEYTGTGFLVDAGGLVLTNRHIAQPWWKNEAATPIVSAGFEPRFLYLRAYFPGRTRPIVFDPQKSVPADDADLAVLAGSAEGLVLPDPLPLARHDALPGGRPVVLLGYPTGLSALLARANDEEAKRLSEQEPFDPIRILDALAAQGLVRPLPTQGHVNDLVAGKLLFDAPSEVGGSGAPVLDLEGRVVAVNYGILKAFSGANFGVPVRFARPLLERARKR